MKKVLFDAHTPYQLMVAASIAYVYYRDDFTTIIIGNALFKDPAFLKNNITKSKLFNQVEVSSETAPKEALVGQLKSFNLEDVDIFHFSSYSTVSSCYLYNILVEKSKIILNEEGAATYDLFEKYDEFKKLFPSNIRENVDLNHLSEVWVFNKLLYNSSYKEKVYEINLNKMLDETYFINSLNLIFDYNYVEIKEKNIFFTQNFLDYGVVTVDEVKDFFYSLKQIYNENLILKLHPFDSNIKIYMELGIKVLKNIEQVPWELVLLNHLRNGTLKDKCFMTVGSSSLSVFYLFLKHKVFEDKSEYILMTRLFETPFNKAFEEYYKRLSYLSDFHYQLVTSYDELNT